VKERDHLHPVILGGEAGPRQLLHGHCHDTKTAQDGSYAARGAHAKGQLTQEPCAGTTRTHGSGGGRGGATLLA
jgi:hypothetical protein